MLFSPDNSSLYQIMKSANAAPSDLEDGEQRSIRITVPERFSRRANDIRESITIKKLKTMGSKYSDLEDCFCSGNSTRPGRWVRCASSTTSRAS